MRPNKQTPMKYNEDVVFAWGNDCDIQHKIREKFLGAIYVYSP